MNYFYVDFECAVTRAINLKKLTLRQYLGASRATGISWAVNADPVQYLAPDANGQFPQDFLEWVESLCLDPDWTWVSHNAAFDVRVWRILCGGSQPQHVHCTLEMAMAAFPNQPGGYKLAMLAETLGLSQRKILLDLAKRHTAEQLEEYCKVDTELCREIHQLALPRISPREIEIGELANQFRELHFVIRPERVTAALQDFGAAAADAVLQAVQHLDRDGEIVSDKSLEAFGWVRKPGTLGADDPGQVKSVKPEKLKALLLERMGFDTRTISWKKINPAHLASNAEAADTLRQTSRASKALSHQRRTAIFANAIEVDAELGAWRAHTYRFSSPSVGRGVNLHNLPKRDKAVAKPVRQMFCLPEGLMFTRADAANVEYRIEGWMSNCRYVKELFTADITADPYIAFGTTATGQVIVKKDPSRQVYKAAVLGLGFIMGVGTWMSQLMLLISDPVNKVTLDDLRAVCIRQGWGPVSDRWVKAHQTRINAPWEVAAVAYHTRLAFHEIHPEFSILAKWLTFTVEKVSSALDPQYALDYCFSLPNAPDRDRLDLLIDNGLSGRSLRAKCGPWTQTVAWRDIGLHETKIGFCLSSRQAGNKGYRKITPNILIENVVQSCARNALCAAKLELKRRGWNYMLSVHDELLIVHERSRSAALAARRDLLDVLGPGNSLGYDWAAVINPREINASESLYEDEDLTTPEWWNRLEQGEESLLDILP